MTAVLGIDLDQTLIYSLRSAQCDAGSDTIWVEDYQNAPLSLMTRAAHDLLADLSLRHLVVPVTTRTPEQYARVRLPGRVQAVVCSNGGVVLRDGLRDAVWDKRLADLLAGVLPAAEVLPRFAAVGGQEWVSSYKQVEDLFVYLVAHSRDVVPQGWVEDLRAALAPGGWTVSVQGRKVYAVPDVVSKAAAALHLSTEVGLPLLAAGDSLLDLPLLQAATWAIRPAHGELHALDPHGQTWPKLAVTHASGAAAAAEILTRLDRTAVHGPPRTGSAL